MTSAIYTVTNKHNNDNGGIIFDWSSRGTNHHFQSNILYLHFMYMSFRSFI